MAVAALRHFVAEASSTLGGGREGGRPLSTACPERPGQSPAPAPALLGLGLAQPVASQGRLGVLAPHPASEASYHGPGELPLKLHSRRESSAGAGLA